MTIDISHVSLSFTDGDRKKRVLNNVTLSADPGTVTAITGPSGSGKSTLLAVASALIVPDNGQVIIDGTDVSHLDAASRTTLRRESIGIVFQQSNLLASLTARDQLLVMSKLGGPFRQEIDPETRADDLLAAVGLADHADKRPHQLSGGQRQRVNIARALMGSPKVLVVDEPTSALDQKSGTTVLELIISLTRQTNTATLLVTHDLRHLDMMDAHYEMVDGVLTEVVDVLARAA